MELLDSLEKLNQQQLTQTVKDCSVHDKAKILKQLESISPSILDQLQKLLQKRQKTSVTEPLDVADLSGNQEDINLGNELLHEGKMGCLLLAGGQGTRLGFEGPKGAYLLEGKSLFERFAEQIRVVSPSLPLAIMTSKANHIETQSFWDNHNHFGLTNVSFFTQQDLPMLDSTGHLFLNSPQSLAMGPNGNGEALKLLVDSGIWDRWESFGVESVNTILVDNLLANPADAELLGYHHRKSNEVSIKCTPRNDPTEKVGVLVKKEGRIAVVEYSELAPSTQKCYANLSLFCFSMKFIKKVSTETLPLHVAKKQAIKWQQGVESSIEAYKFEFFIFDNLSFAEKSSALAYPRDECFLPLKNATGPDSPATVVQKLKCR